MSDRKVTIYISQADEDRLKRIAAELKRKGVAGLLHSNGELNRSGIFHYMIEHYESVDKNEVK